MKNISSAHAGLGLIHMKEEDYKKAIVAFRNALEHDPDSIDLRSNLAKAYAKSGEHEKSESEYRNILDFSSTQLDAILGISELYISMGDADLEKDMSEDAEDKFIMAMDLLNQARVLAESKDFESNHASKLLNKVELSGMYYSVGYVKAKLFEIKKRRDDKLLQSARKAFTRVIKGSPNYQKARRAIKKIDERMDEYKRARSTRGAGLIVAVSIGIFVIGQLTFFLGKPDIYNSRFSLNEKKLASLIKQEKFSISPNEFSSLLNKQFFDLDKVEKEITQIMKTDSVFRKSKADIKTIIDVDESWGLKGFTAIDSALYGTLTFGSIIFIIAGLYIKEFSRLKFGVIELEKKSTQQDTIPTSLGIN